MKTIFFFFGFILWGRFWSYFPSYAIYINTLCWTLTGYKTLFQKSWHAALSSIPWTFSTEMKTSLTQKVCQNVWLPADLSKFTSRWLLPVLIHRLWFDNVYAMNFKLIINIYIWNVHFPKRECCFLMCEKWKLTQKRRHPLNIKCLTCIMLYNVVPLLFCWVTRESITQSAWANQQLRGRVRQRKRKKKSGKVRVREEEEVVRGLIWNV